MGIWFTFEGKPRRLTRMHTSQISPKIAILNSKQAICVNRVSGEFFENSCYFILQNKTMLNYDKNVILKCFNSDFMISEYKSKSKMWKELYYRVEMVN